MVSFLRKIRQKLLSQNRVTRYLAYAVGEIALVMIGILLALQVNTWNEERNMANKQERQFRLIRQEMANNLVLLEQEEEKLSTRLEKQLQFFQLVNSKSVNDSISEEEFNQLLWQAFNKRVETPIENAALNELISSGGLKDIKNDSIKKFLASWDSRLNDLKMQENRITETDKAYNLLVRESPDFSFRVYLSNVFPDRGIAPPPTPKSNKKIIRDQEFENTILTFWGQERRVLTEIYPKYKNDLLAIIEALDQELQKP
jgi:hypothetical protein